MLKVVERVPALPLLGLGVMLAVLLFAGCAHMKEDTTVCPEYRQVRCLTPVACSMDTKRKCRVCQCEAEGIHTPIPGPPDQQQPPATPNTQQPIRP